MFDLIKKTSNTPNGHFGMLPSEFIFVHVNIQTGEYYFYEFDLVLVNYKVYSQLNPAILIS